LEPSKDRDRALHEVQSAGVLELQPQQGEFVLDALVVDADTRSPLHVLVDDRQQRGISGGGSVTRLVQRVLEEVARGFAVCGPSWLTAGARPGSSSRPVLSCTATAVILVGCLIGRLIGRRGLSLSAFLYLAPSLSFCGQADLRQFGNIPPPAAILGRRCSVTRPAARRKLRLLYTPATRDRHRREGYTGPSGRKSAGRHQRHADVLPVLVRSGFSTTAQPACRNGLSSFSLPSNQPIAGLPNRVFHDVADAHVASLPYAQEVQGDGLLLGIVRERQRLQALRHLVCP